MEKKGFPDVCREIKLRHLIFVITTIIIIIILYIDFFGCLLVPLCFCAVYSFELHFCFWTGFIIGTCAVEPAC
jgi:hypothetical protein